MKAGFEQAGIKIRKEQEFGALRDSIARLLSPAVIERFFKKLQESDLRIREFEKILAKGVMEKVDPGLTSQSVSSQQLYEALPLTDQAQLREFYLVEIEKVDSALREKFQKLYRYY